MQGRYPGKVASFLSLSSLCPGLLSSSPSAEIHIGCVGCCGPSQISKTANHRSPASLAAPGRLLHAAPWWTDGLHSPQRAKGRCEEEQWSRPPAFLVGVCFFRGVSMNGGTASLVLGTLKTLFTSCVLSASSVTTCSAPSFFSLSVSFWRSGLETKHEPRSHPAHFLPQRLPGLLGHSCDNVFLCGKLGSGLSRAWSRACPCSSIVL